MESAGRRVEGSEHILRVEQLKRAAPRLEFLKTRAQLCVGHQNVHPRVADNESHFLGLQKVVDGHHHAAAL